ncbi:unnamed protein product, partial [Ectocarpus fasciculatus]
AWFSVVDVTSIAGITSSDCVAWRAHMGASSILLPCPLDEVFVKWLTRMLAGAHTRVAHVSQLSRPRQRYPSCHPRTMRYGRCGRPCRLASFQLHFASDNIHGP